MRRNAAPIFIAVQYICKRARASPFRDWRRTALDLTRSHRRMTLAKKASRAGGVSGARPRPRALRQRRHRACRGASARRARERLTPIRRRVLEALLASHQPLGAYELIDRLAARGARPAPITIYRALDFLREQGLVHRIESRNAFIACVHNHDSGDPVVFLICEKCGAVGEAACRRGRRHASKPPRAPPASRRRRR